MPVALCLRGLNVSRSSRFFVFPENKIITSGSTITTMSLSTFAVPPPPITSVPIHHSSTSSQQFPVHRIYCVAKNYADHVREMGGTPEKDPPCFFTKPSDAIVWVGTTTSPESSSSPTRATPSIPYALATNQLEYEVELVIAIGSAGTNIQPTEALKHVFGYAVGIDLTRRDLQAQAKKGGRPWDSAKAFDQSAPIGSITQVFPEKRNEKEQERFKTAQIWLSVNEQVKQQGSVGDMIWNVPEIISALSSQFHLLPGDLIYTGTPSGVGPLVKGDRIKAGIDGLEPIEFTIA